MPASKPKTPGPQSDRKRRAPPARKVGTIKPASETDYRRSPEHVAKMRAGLERWKAENGHPTAKGVKQGWGGKAGRKRLEEIRSKAAEEAAIIMEELDETGLTLRSEVGREVLRHAIAVVRGKETYGDRERLAAMKIVLEYSEAKPAATINVNNATADSFLDSVLAEARAKA